MARLSWCHNGWLARAFAAALKGGRGVGGAEALGPGALAPPVLRPPFRVARILCCQFKFDAPLMKVVGADRGGARRGFGDRSVWARQVEGDGAPREDVHRAVGALEPADDRDQ